MIEKNMLPPKYTGSVPQGQTNSNTYLYQIAFSTKIY